MRTSVATIECQRTSSLSSSVTYCRTEPFQPSSSVPSPTGWWVRESFFNSMDASHPCHNSPVLLCTTTLMSYYVALNYYLFILQQIYKQQADIIFKPLFALWIRTFTIYHGCGVVCFLCISVSHSLPLSFLYRSGGEVAKFLHLSALHHTHIMVSDVRGVRCQRLHSTAGNS